MNWTTEFPTKPGYYWIRNYVFNSSSGHTDDPTPGPDIAEIKVDEYSGSLAAFWPDSEREWNHEDFLSAEFYGPLEPPESTDHPGEGLDMGRRVAYGTRVAVKVTEIKRLSEMMSLACIETAPAENSEPEAYFCIYEYSMPGAPREGGQAG